MNNPLLSIIIPTHNRPQLVVRAVKSALEQTVKDLEIIVVDDASEVTPELPQDSRVRMVRLSQPSGGSVARNVGTRAARSRWITYLDDDDRLLPDMVEQSLKALSKHSSKEPVALISGLEVVNVLGEVTQKRIPPQLHEKGSHFFLEEIEPDYSHNTKQTLVVERQVIEQIGGWDETFRSRVHSELFLRLNPACSIIGLPVVTYQLTAHEGTRVSQNVKLRIESFQRLINKHHDLFKAHPKTFADFLFKHGERLLEMGQIQHAILTFLRAMQLDLKPTLLKLKYLLKYLLLDKNFNENKSTVSTVIDNR